VVDDRPEADGLVQQPRLSTNGETKMSDNQEKTKSDVGLTTAFRAGMGAAQSMHQTAIEIPLKILQEFGVAEDKMEGLREKSRELIGGLYHMIDDAAVKTGFVQAREGEEGEQKKAAKG
jgi:hypothetical protein